MLDPDISTADALAHLSAAPDHVRDADDPAAISRRRFLQLVGMGVGAGLSGTALFEALGAPLAGFDAGAFAAPVGPGDGILVVLGMYGGNDGWNTVVPLTDGHYHDQHGSLAIPAADTLPLDGRLGLHPALGTLHSMWGQGRLAVVEGVGYPDPDLSHFTSMAIWMSAIRHGVPSSGWLGRWLDGHLAGGPDLYTAASIGSSVPLHMVGRSRRATAVPNQRPGFGGGTEPHDQRLQSALRSLAAPAGRGVWHDAVTGALRDQLDLAERLGPVIPATLPAAPLTASLEVAARLINADLGFRVLETGWGDFDSHAGQPSQHGARMAELDAAVARFFAELDPVWAGRVTVMTFSEFGRTSYANGSNGTDHGTASSMLVFGANVRGGTYGAAPSLAGVGRWDRVAHTVDLRSYYASIIDGWLGGGSSDVLGGSYENLGLFRSSPSGAPIGGGGGGGGGGGPVVVGPAGAFTAISPARVADTRDGTGGVPAHRMGTGEPLRVGVAGSHGIPGSGVTAVVANVTATEVSEPTYLTVSAGSSTRPPTSNLNPMPGMATPNLVVMAVGADGHIDVHNAMGETHCIVDVFGYFVDGPGDRFTAVDPERVLDTRPGLGARAGLVARGERIDVPIAGRAGVPADGVSAVVLNVTAAGPASSGYLTIGPGGEPVPATSNLNFVADQTVPNLVVCKVGPAGDVSLAVETDGVHVIADVFGYFGTSGARVRTVSPSRLLDTRDGTGTGADPTRLGPGGEVVLQVAGRGGVPDTATAAVLNLTTTDVSATTYVTAWPDGIAQPYTSNLNAAAGATVANLAIVRLGAGGRIRLANDSGDIALIADVFGFFVD